MIKIDTPETVDASEEQLLSLFSDLFENHLATGNSVVYGDVDALEQAAMGNGEWGVVINAENEKGVWVLIEEGTFVAWETGLVTVEGYDWTEDEFDHELSVDRFYDFAYTILAKYIPAEDMPDRIPDGDVTAEGEALSRQADLLDEEADDDLAQDDNDEER